MEHEQRTNYPVYCHSWSQESAAQMVEFLQHRVEAMASRMEFLEAENEVLKQTLLNELHNA